MPRYKYKVKDENGKVSRGEQTVPNEVELHEKLKADGKYLIDVKLVEENKNRKRLKSNQIAEFSRNISKLVGAGITLVKALKIVSDDETIKPKEREIYVDVLKLVRQGMPLSDALEEQGDAFPTLFVSMMRSAESSGNIDKVSEKMAEYYEKDYRMKKRVSSSMTYPKILCGLIIAVVAIIVGFVLPQFKEMFDKIEQLPLATEILMAISNFMKTKWYIILVVGFIVVMSLRLLLIIPKVKYYRDKILVKLPIIGKLMKIIYTARFAQTLASMYSAGISIINCLHIAKTTIDNSYIESQFDQVIADVQSGENLSTSLDKVDGFGKKMMSALKVGEETGTMDTMLISLAEQMEFDADMALNRLVSYLEPVMIVVMAIIVGFIIIAVILPIYQSYGTIGAN